MNKRFGKNMGLVALGALISFALQAAAELPRHGATGAPVGQASIFYDNGAGVPVKVNSSNPLPITGATTLQFSDHEQVTCASTAVQFDSLAATAMCLNNADSSVDIYIGLSDVSTTNGFLLKAGAGACFGLTASSDELYCRTATTSADVTFFTEG